jgi:hypothetical protein
MVVDVHTHASLRWLMPDYHAPAETEAKLRRINRFTEGTSLPRVPEEVKGAIISRDSLALLGLS